MNRNFFYMEVLVIKQEKIVFNMVCFIRSQILMFLEKFNELDVDEQVDICELLYDYVDEFYCSCFVCFGDDGENF